MVQPKVLVITLLAWQGGGPPRYLPAHLTCAVFHESVTGEARAEARGGDLNEHFGREGILALRAVAADSGLAVEAWLDSLTIWRENASGRVEPDAEGLLGGRWIGRLEPDGRWIGSQVPFIPDEVALVTDLRPLLEEFLPRLPGRVLSVGAADSANGRVIRREQGAGDLQRYAWRAASGFDTTATLGDSVRRMRRETTEEGWLLWSPVEGPVRWERSVTTTLVPEGRNAGRGVAVQRIAVVRLRGHPACPASGG